MSRKRKNKGDDGGDSWLATYADMVTLLLTFFIMLYAMSTVNDVKYNKVIEAITGELNPNQIKELEENADFTDDIVTGEFNIDDDPADVQDDIDIEELDEDDILDNFYSTMEKYFKDRDDVDISRTDEYITIRFSDNVTFAGYSSVVKDEGKEIIKVLADALKEAETEIDEVIISGHTAKVSTTHTDLSRTLSTDRANSVLLYLESLKAIEPSKYVAVGYGNFRPIADNSTREGRSKNRRVEVQITQKERQDEVEKDN